MKTIFKRLGAGLALAALCGTAAPAQQGGTINGAGATFPYPIYTKWAHMYEQATRVKINYQGIGSGGGIAQIKARTVRFAGSDVPLMPNELSSAGLMQFPMVIGGVVPIVNIPGVSAGQLKLTPELLAAIFLGQVTKWNDAAIAAENPGLNLPNRAITVVHRADGSGTSWIFTNYLSKVSAAWRGRVGFASAVEWPCGVGGKGNEGVAAYVKRIAGAIGYVEYAYALQNRIAHAQMKNRAGRYVQPSIETFQAAAANADWSNAPGFYMVITDQPGENTWPITGATFILMRKEQADAAIGKAILSFFDWCYANGDQEAVKLHYIPMPQNVVTLVKQSWSRDLRAGGQSIWP